MLLNRTPKSDMLSAKSGQGEGGDGALGAWRFSVIPKFMYLFTYPRLVQITSGNYILGSSSSLMVLGT